MSEKVVACGALINPRHLLVKEHNLCLFQIAY